MAAIIRPYARALTGAGQVLPPISAAGQLQLNPKSPFYRGLLCAYLPSISPVDYAGNCGPLRYYDYQAAISNLAIIHGTPEGNGLAGSNITNYAASTPSNTTPNSICNWAVGATYYVRLFQWQVSTASETLMFIADASHCAMGLNTGSPAGQYQFFYGAFSPSPNSATQTANKMYGMCCSMTPNPGTSTLYINGVASSATTTSLTAPTLLALATTNIALQAGADAAMLAFYIWNRAFTATEALLLERAPYGLFQPAIANYFPIGTVASPDQASPLTMTGFGN